MNETVVVHPRWESGFVMLSHRDFSGPPTRWVLDEGAGSIPAVKTLEWK